MNPDVQTEAENAFHACCSTMDPVLRLKEMNAFVLGFMKGRLREQDEAKPSACSNEEILKLFGKFLDRLNSFDRLRFADSILVFKAGFRTGMLRSGPEGFLALVKDELAMARRKHPGPQTSLHHGYAVLLEEVDEFWDEVRKKSECRDYGKIADELIQIAAMAMRTYEDVVRPKLVGKTQP